MVDLLWTARTHHSDPATSMASNVAFRVLPIPPASMADRSSYSCIFLVVCWLARLYALPGLHPIDYRIVAPRHGIEAPGCAIERAMPRRSKARSIGNKSRFMLNDLVSLYTFSPYRVSRSSQSENTVRRFTVRREFLLTRQFLCFLRIVEWIIKYNR